MADWVKAPGRERFTFHDLRAYYVTVLVGRDETPETHANPATARREYDRQRVVKIKGQRLRQATIVGSCHHPEMKKGTPLSRKCLISFEFFGVADGTRTHDNRNHNPGLYQLSYSHHIFLALTPNRHQTADARNFVFNCKEAEF